MKETGEFETEEFINAPNASFHDDFGLQRARHRQCTSLTRYLICEQLYCERRVNGTFDPNNKTALIYGSAPHSPRSMQVTMMLLNMYPQRSEDIDRDRADLIKRQGTLIKQWLC
jgi:hypothetical protein